MSTLEEREARQTDEVLDALVWADENGLDVVWTARLLGSYTRKVNIRNDVQTQTTANGERSFYVNPETGKEMSTSTTGGSVEGYRVREVTEGPPKNLGRPSKATGQARDRRKQGVCLSCGQPFRPTGTGSGARRVCECDSKKGQGTSAKAKAVRAKNQAKRQK